MSADRELTGSHVDLASKIDQYFEAWNSRDLTALRALFDERVELHWSSSSKFAISAMALCCAAQPAALDVLGRLGFFRSWFRLET